MAFLIDEEAVGLVGDPSLVLADDAAGMARCDVVVVKDDAVGVLVGLRLGVGIDRDPADLEIGARSDLPYRAGAAGAVLDARVVRVPDRK